jgi:hypothetical protein
VFTAVTWRRLDATAQGLALLALTVVAASLAVGAGRRRLTATAEALGAVAVLLVLADVHAFRIGLAPGADPATFWAAGLAVAAVTGWALAGAASIRSSRLLAVVLGQLPLLALLTGSAFGPGEQALVLLQVAVVVLVLPRSSTLDPLARRLGAVVAGLQWWAIALVAVVQGVGRWAWAGAYDRSLDPAELAGPAAVLGAAGLAALVVALQHAGRSEVRRSALVAATSTLLLAAWLGAGARWDLATSVAVVVLLSAASLLAVRRLPSPWRQAPTAVLVPAFAAASVPSAATAASLLLAASEVGRDAWDLDPATLARDLLPAGEVLVRPSLLGLHVLALVLLAGLPIGPDQQVAGRRWPGWFAALGASLALVVGPAALPVSIGQLVVASLLVAAVGALAGPSADRLLLAGAATSPDGDRGRAVRLARGGAGVAAASCAWALAWGQATPTLTVAVVAGSVVLALLVAVGARGRDDGPLLGAAVAWAAAALPAAVGLLLAATELSAPQAWAAAATAGAVVLVLGALVLDPTADAEGPCAQGLRALEATSAAVHVVALAVLADLGDLRSLAVALAAGTVALALHAARPERRPLALAAAGEGLVVTWLLLADRNVGLVEAYTVPVAVVLLGIGASLGRSRPVGPVPSWWSLGPGLVVALAPTAWIALVEAGPVRPLVALVAGAAVLVAGAVRGLRAPFDLGAVTVVVLGVRQLAPVVGSLPNWATIGSTGLVLLGVGATFEQRRRELASARRRYASLR